MVKDTRAFNVIEQTNTRRVEFRNVTNRKVHVIDAQLHAKARTERKRSRRNVNCCDICAPKPTCEQDRLLTCATTCDEHTQPFSRFGKAAAHFVVPVLESRTCAAF